MAISRVSGPLLHSNLDRQGVDLQFTTNNLPLIYCDFSTFTVSINANNQTATDTFNVNGSARIGNTRINNSTISSPNDLTILSNGNITLYPQGRLIAPHSNLGNLVVQDTTISSLGNIILAPLNGNTYISNLNILNSTITSTSGILAISPAGTAQIGNIVVTKNAISVLANAHLSLAGTVVSDVGYPLVPTDVATVQYVLDHAGTITGNIVALTQGDSLVSLTDNVGGAGTMTVVLDNKLIATFANAYINLANLTISGNTISSTGNITLSPTGVVDASGSTITNAGYPVRPTDVATVQYVTNNLAALHANSISQGNSTVSVTDLSGPGGHVDITADGNLVATFTSNGSTLGNLTISTNTISSAGNINLTPGPSQIVSVNSNSAMQVPVGLSADRPVNPAEGYLRYNSFIKMLEVFNGTTWITAQSMMTSQILTGNNSTTTFSLSQPEIADNILVMINGVVQVPNVAYTTSGSNIIFAEAPLSTETIQIRIISQSTNTASTLPTTVVVDSTAIIVDDIIFTNLDTFATNAYQTAKYLLSVLYPSGEAQLVEILLSQNQTTDAKYVVTASPVTGGSVENLIYSAYPVGGLCIFAARSSVPGTKVKIQKTYFTI